MSKNIEILETKTLGEWKCTRPIQTYNEREIPRMMEYIETDYFSSFLNEYGLGKIEITADQMEEFLLDVEFNSFIQWENDDIEFIKTIEEILQREPFVQIEVW